MPLTDEFKDEELKTMAEGFTEMGVKPNLQSKEKFQKWLLDFSTGAKPKSDGATASASTQDKSPNTYQTPRLPNFSGDKKGDATFDLWKYEVECLCKDKYSDATITQAIRRSVRGEAARVIMRLGADAKVDDILYKLESIFGTIDTKSSILSEFFSAKQKDDEDVASWGCRLEDLINKAIHLKQVKPSEANEMLRNMFYEGMKSTLQDTTGYIFEKIRDFDELRKTVRRKEEEMNKRKTFTFGQVKQVTTTESQSIIDQLKDMVQKLSLDVTDMKKDINEGKQSTQDSCTQIQQINDGYRGYYRGGWNRPYNRGYQKWRPRGGYIQDRDPQQSMMGNQQSMGNTEDNQEPTCHRCNQKGHIAIGCRVRLDHSNRALNFRRPLSRRGR